MQATVLLYIEVDVAFDVTLMHTLARYDSKVWDETNSWKKKPELAAFCCYHIKVYNRFRTIENVKIENIKFKYNINYIKIFMII